MDKAKVLVIDDDVHMQKLLEITLQSNDYAVRLASNAKEGLVATEDYQPDIVLLDLGLPDKDGQSVLEKLREWYTAPIIILSARNELADIIKTLDTGANDYVTKPFRTGELLKKMRSALVNVNQYEREPIPLFGDLDINFAQRIVKKNSKTIILTNTEYSLLTLFVRNEGRVLTDKYLLRSLWGPGYINQSQYLRICIARIREKIEDDPNRPVLIVTESGLGYRFIGER